MSARSKSKGSSAVTIASSQNKARKKQRDEYSSVSGKKSSTLSQSCKSGTTALAKVECDSPTTVKLRHTLRHRPPVSATVFRHSGSFKQAPSHTTPTNGLTQRLGSASHLFLKFNSPHKKQQPAVRSSLSVGLSRAHSSTSGPLPSRTLTRPFEGGGGGGGGTGSGGGGRFKDNVLTIEDVARGLARKQFRNVIVMSGAGVSTPSGIPDFR